MDYTYTSLVVIMIVIEEHIKCTFQILEGDSIN